MQSLAISTVLFLAALPSQENATTVKLFAEEPWYKTMKGEPTMFEGVLKKTERAKNIIGFGRFNPFRLEMADGKVREVYHGGKPTLLDPYVGKKVKIVGKAVDMEVEGRMHREIWPASLTVAEGDAKVQGKATGLKIHAKAPIRIGAAPGAITSAEQLGKLQNTDPDKASANVAKMLKVERIDWSTQMLIVISGGTQRTGGYSVEVKSVEDKDGKLIVNWKLNTPAPGSIVTQALTNPAQTILVDRSDKQIQFNPPSPPAGGGKKLGN